MLMNNTLLEEARQVLNSAHSILIVSHVRPDGDAIGSTLGLGLTLQTAGKQVQMVLKDGVPLNFKHLSGAAEIKRKPEGEVGTVVGMIEIFGSQTAVGNSPAILAHGISVALYNTAFGLIVAIPSMIFYRHFRSQVDTLTIEMEQQAIKLVAIVHGQREG